MENLLLKYTERNVEKYTLGFFVVVFSLSSQLFYF